MSPAPRNPGDDELVVGSTVYRRGMRIRLRPGVEGPDSGVDGRTGTIDQIHSGGPGPAFLSVEVDADPDRGAEPLRHVFVAPSQVDVLEEN